MLNPTITATNLSHHLIQRESNFGLHGDPRLFPSYLYRERLRVAKNLYKYDLKGHFGCVNAIEFSHGGQYLASGGDDKRVLVWDIEKSLAGVASPRSLATEQSSNIFCLGFDSQNRKLISGGNDALAISHDFETGKLDNVFKHEEPVYGLSVDPQNDSIFATASENGVVLLFDQRTDPADPLVVASLSSSFHAVEFHPFMSHLLVTANSKRGAALYDIRKPKEPVVQYVNLGNLRSCMSVRFNKTGNLILGLRRRLTPILYSVNSPDRICTFYHSYYYNSCTMKSCTFAGEDDELVISGSDDFNLYVWRLSDIDFEAVEQWVETTQMVLYGHRSIVNQVRYNREKCLLASSGVEKIVKIWSPFSQHNWSGSLTEEATCSENPRELYSPYNLFTMALPENWHHLSHDYSSENTNEDPRMMAFFDSLIQQEIEGWDTDGSSSETSQNGEQSNTSMTRSSCGSSSSNSSSCSNMDTTSSSSSSSSSSSDSDSDNENNKKPIATRSARNANEAKLKVSSVQKVPRSQSRSKDKDKDRMNQSQVPTNRIAYLISKKRNTLRRLALKGSSIDSRRSDKTTVAAKRRTNASSRSKDCKKKTLAKDRSITPDSNFESSITSTNSNTNNIDEPSTSKAATSVAAITCNSSSSHAKVEYVKSAESSNESNSSSDEHPSNFVVSGSSRSNIANVSSTSNNANIPSTSTGITSNFRDAFLRLSRQIFMSDSEDDDSDGDAGGGGDGDGGSNNQQNGKSGTSTDAPTTPKKLNGTNRAAASSLEHEIHCNSNVNEAGRSSKRPSKRNSRHRPKTTAALSVIKANSKTTLPQASPATANDLLSRDDLNTDYSSSSSSSSASSKSSSRSINRESNSTRRNSINMEVPKKRRCEEECSLQQKAPYSVRHTSNPSYDDHTLSSTSSSSTSSALSVMSGCKDESTHANDMPTSFSASLLKKRKISINDYIHLRSTTTDSQQMEENNNETNNNDVFAIESNNANISGQETPQRLRSESNQYTSYLNGNNNNSYFLTPDSGISLNNSLATPITDAHNDTHEASTSRSSRIISQLSPCLEDNSNVENASHDAVLISNRNANINNYQQKLERVRRNYRKHFVDDTESE